MTSNGFESESHRLLWEEAECAYSTEDFHSAERLYRRLLMRSSHGPDNVETLSVLVELIKCLKAQSLFDEAELYRQRVQQYFDDGGANSCPIDGH